MKTAARNGYRVAAKALREPAGTDPAAFAVEQAWRTLEHTGRSIDRADSKAGAALAASGGTGAILYNLADTRPIGPWPGLALVISATLTLSAAVFAGFALWPRRGRGSKPTSLVYFDHVVRAPGATANEYVSNAAILFHDPEALYRDLSSQIWATGQVATAKYAWVDRAMACLLAGLLTTGASALIIRY